MPLRLTPHSPGPCGWTLSLVSKDGQGIPVLLPSWTMIAMSGSPCGRINALVVRAILAQHLRCLVGSKDPQSLAQCSRIQIQDRGSPQVRQRPGPRFSYQELHSVGPPVVDAPKRPVLIVGSARRNTTNITHAVGVLAWGSPVFTEIGGER